MATKNISNYHNGKIYPSCKGSDQRGPDMGILAPTSVYSALHTDIHSVLDVITVKLGLFEEHFFLMCKNRLDSSEFCHLSMSKG